MRLIIFVVCLVVSFSFTNAVIDTSTCGSEKICIYSTNGCSVTDPTCLFFSYAWNSTTNDFTMELSGSTGGGGQYVAVAFSPDNQMKDSDLYYCLGTELKSGSIQALQNQPVTTGSLPPQLSSVSAANANGVAECRFTRAANVSKLISNGVPSAFDLAITNYYVLLAIGSYTSGDIVYHGPDGRFSFNAIQNFTAPIGTTTTAAPSGVTADCDITKGCFQEPASCVPGSASCMFASWQYDKDTNMFTFDIIGGVGSAGQYAAIGFAGSNMMQDADVYYCTDGAFSSASIGARWQAPSVLPTPPEITVNSVGSNGGVVSCSFVRPAALSKTVSGGSVDFNLLTSNYYLLYAVGRTTGVDGPLIKHTAKIASIQAINFTQVNSAGGGDSTGVNINLVKAHAGLMIFAWLTCASIGAIIARHFKPLWQDNKCCGEKVWFQLHRTLMVTAVLATIVGFILIFVAKGRYSENAGAHPIIGIIVTVLALVNPIMAICRPHPNEPKRPIFNWAHWFVGSWARILGIAAIFLGVDLPLLNIDEWDTWVLVGFVVFHVIVEIVLELLSAYYGHIAAYKKPTEDVFGENGEKLKEPPPQGGAIKYAILLFYSAGNIGFLIAFIISIAGFQ